MSSDMGSVSDPKVWFKMRNVTVPVDLTSFSAVLELFFKLNYITKPTEMYEHSA